MAIIDQEVRKLIFTLLGASLLLITLIWFASNNTSLFNNFTTNVANNITGTKVYNKPYDYNLDKNKNYYLNINTSEGTMSFLLSKEATPNTVNNIVNLVKDGFYNNSSYIEKKPQYVLFGKNSDSGNVGYNIQEEISAKSLGFDETTVSQYPALREVYGNDVDNYPNAAVESYLKSKGYTYMDTLKSNVIKKGSLVMYSETPSSFNNIFFVSSVDKLPSVDGRMTNFGELTSGQDVLDKVVNNPAVTVTSITITEK